jgi:hypothetical protein
MNQISGQEDDQWHKNEDRLYGEVRNDIPLDYSGDFLESVFGDLDDTQEMPDALILEISEHVQKGLDLGIFGENK